MLLQSFQGKLRLVRGLAKTADARFGDLRAYGAFLVSSRLGAASCSTCASSAKAAAQSSSSTPGPAKMVRVYKNGQDAGAQSGAEITIPTAKGDVLNIATDGTSLADIMSRVVQQTTN